IPQHLPGVKTSLVYDGFTGPLSANWDVGHAHGTFTIDPNNGVYGEGHGSNFLPLSSKYFLPENYTIECNLCTIKGKEAGIFLKAAEDQKYGSNYPYHIYLERGGLSTYRTNREYNKKIEDGRYYHLKIELEAQN
ncbi:MAG: hypothetical protein QHH75_14870, partial [Bacillota bacterium]|nr:hypothetical protein [Bacillota bacterium]